MVDEPQRKSFRRRFFLFLTDPSSSWFSAIFFLLLIVAIALSSMIMIMQTMKCFQYTPTECGFCYGDGEDDDLTDESFASNDMVVECQCPPRPSMYLETILNYLLKLFAVEWTLRVLTYVPAHPKSNFLGKLYDWIKFLTSSTTLIDALAIWPYFVEKLQIPGLISLRLLRLFRVFQLLRLGSYNSMFVSLTTVLSKSMEFLKLLLVIVFFGAAIFGSLMYWLEQGEWKYWEPTGNFQYIRLSINGETEEISPFTSIPTSFWWFVVTATTVGYGDYYPTSVAGMWVGTIAMLTGVLVIAFPVSVFSDLWSEELKQVKVFESLYKDDGSDSDNEKGNDNNMSTEHVYEENISLIGRQHLRDQYEQIYSERESPSRNPRHVIMDKEDLDNIISSIHAIQQEQRRIQKLLKKYYIHNENRQTD
eukprot:jgi/Psemu1/296616/fgenesh1_pm.180_\